MKVLMFLKVDPNLGLAVCVPYKVNCRHIFTIRHDNANDNDHHIHHNGLDLVMICLYGRQAAKRGDICWVAKHLQICSRLYLLYLYLLYLLGRQILSHHQQVLYFSYLFAICWAGKNFHICNRLKSIEFVLPGFLFQDW